MKLILLIPVAMALRSKTVTRREINVAEHPLEIRPSKTPTIWIESDDDFL